MTIRIGLIGAGGMGRAHVERIENELAGGRITAVADLNLDGAKEVAEPLGARAYGSGAELIAAPDVDAVLIATFGKVHAPDVIAAIEAGKRVLCEKPLATTPEDCIAIMEAEQRAGKKLVTVGFMRRFDAGYQQMRAALECGELGGATLVHCRHRNPSVPEGYTTRNMIDDTAIHEIDICRYLLDEEIVSVRVDAPRSTSARTMVDFAVPFSPRTKTPPISGEMLARISARAMSSAPRTAVNGNFITVQSAFLWVRAHVACGWADDLARRSADAGETKTRFGPRFSRLTVAGPLRTRTAFRTQPGYCSTSRPMHSNSAFARTIAASNGLCRRRRWTR